MLRRTSEISTGSFALGSITFSFLGEGEGLRRIRYTQLPRMYGKRVTPERATLLRPLFRVKGPEGGPREREEVGSWPTTTG